MLCDVTIVRIHDARCVSFLDLQLLAQSIFVAVTVVAAAAAAAAAAGRGALLMVHYSR